MLLIDGEEIINNDGVHYEIFREGFAGLEQGEYSIDVQYFDFTGCETLNVKIWKQTGEMHDINQFIRQYMAFRWPVPPTWNFEYFYIFLTSGAMKKN